MLRIVLAATVFLGTSRLEAADPFPLENGDTVAFVGNTFVEREQREGYIELALTLALPEADLKFRNLGWSGDTVSGRSRRFFGATEEGFQHLLQHLDIVKPSVIFVSYGTNEAFDGERGRQSFIEGYSRLLDELQKRTERITLITSPPLDASRSPAPQVAIEANKELEWQSIAVRDLAAERGFGFIDIYSPLAKAFSETTLPISYTENGMHLTPDGYKAVAGVIAMAAVRDDSGRNDSPIVAIGRSLTTPQEQLRQAIVEKNELFFHRHRPQNETYLRGFRKHEQGNNAAEIIAFEPLVAEKDQQIFSLRKKATRP